MRRLILLTCLFLPALTLNAQLEGSHVKLKGKRLSQFYRTAGRSELRRRISLMLPAKVLPTRDRGRSLWVKFQYKGVPFSVRRDNPYWIQTRRKLRKSNGGKVLLKGHVRLRRKTSDDNKVWVLVDSLQKTRAKRKKRGKN